MDSPPREYHVSRLAGIIAILAASSAAAQEIPDSVRQAAQDAPLFASHDLLDVTLRAPLRSIFGERSDDSEEYDGVLSYPSGDSTASVDVEVRTRGNFRLQRNVCEFPPLRLDFPKSKVQGTLFQGQDKLKLVTHCDDDREDYEQNVLEEYLAYRIYNLLTRASFRVRLLRATYVDTDERRDTLTRYAFLIEDDAMLAARMGYELLSVPSVPPNQLEQRQLSLFEMFQYLIANTDWSAFNPEPDEDECCHNAKLIGFMWGPVLPVPYDFDWSGFVNARYARPDPRVGTRSVRDRRFWGVCRSAESLESVLPIFDQQRDAITQLVREQVGLEDDERQETLEYIDEFYRVIDDPGRFRRQVLDRCREWKMGG